MKTKTFLLLCLLIGFGLTQLSAQKLPEIGKSGSWAFTFIWDYTDDWGYGVAVPLNCNYSTIDELVGTVRCHTVYHWTNYDGNPNDWDWCRQTFDGQLKSKLTPEVFQVKDILTAKGPVSAAIPATGHFNLIGDQGTHYIVNYIWDINGMTFVNVKCIGHK